MLKKDAAGRYRATRGTEVSFQIVPVGTAGTVTAALDGKEVPNTGSAELPIFRFMVTKKIGSAHLVLIDYQIYGEQEGAHFDVAVRASSGEEYPELSVRATAAREYEFRVTQ